MSAAIDLSVATRFLCKCNPSVGGTGWRPGLYVRRFSGLVADPSCSKAE